jgi:hypothetical protein
VGADRKGRAAAGLGFAGGEMSVIFDQSDLWDVESRVTIALAVTIVGSRLSHYTGLSPDDSFEQVFGTLFMRFTPSLKTHALALWGGIRFQKTDVITLPLVIHELGHLFAVRAKNKPTKQLWLDRNKLDTRAGSEYPGMHPPSLPKYNVVEQFCNAWEVWVLELYTQNSAGITPAGRALRDWMDAHMGEWCAIARAV